MPYQYDVQLLCGERGGEGKPARRRRWGWDEIRQQKGKQGCGRPVRPHSQPLFPNCFEGRERVRGTSRRAGKGNWAGQVGGTRTSPAQQRR